MKNITLLAYILMLLPFNSFAAKVVQINKDSAVISTEDIKNESAKSFVIDLGQGEQCVAPLISKKESYLLIDTVACGNKDKIRTGQTATEAIEFLDSHPVAKTSEPSTESTAKRMEIKSHNYLWSIVPSTSISGTANFPQVSSFDGTTVSYGDVEYKLNSGASIKVEYGQIDKDSFNFSFGGGYEFVRTINSIIINTTGGSSYTGAASGRISTFFISAMGDYRWDSFYIGLGFLGAGVQGTELPPAWNNMKSSIGADVNFGWYVNENMAVDFSSRSFSVKMDSYTSAGTTANLGSGYISSLNIGLKYVFH